ncbi:MAG: FAD-dependent oxidoreductase [Deltaproteobacteria bacterium]|nr:FAD-dependent oxidoreductase [Deltaproteobacteria bacterium]
MKRKHLIIGSGPAGLTALETIRRLTTADDIFLISKEACLPYSPTALPYLLSGQIEESKLWTASEMDFQKLSCRFYPGKQVHRIIPNRNEIVFKNGEKERFDTLLIATGSTPIRPSLEGIEDIGFFGFHTLADYHELVKRLNGKREVLLYGGGLVTMSLASGLLKKGFKVRIIVRSRILRSYFNPCAGDIIAQGFVTRGAEIITGREICRVGKTGDRFEAELTDGSVFWGDLFICCLGTTPRIDFLEGSAIAVNRGILVNHRMETNIPGIYAAGDVAEATDIFGRPGINAIVPNAVAQGKVAGSNMAGEKKEFEGWIPMNVFSFFENMACSIGACQAEGNDREVLEQEAKPGKTFKRLVFQDERLIGALFVNEEVDPGIIRYLIEKRIPLKEHKALLLEKTKDACRWLRLREDRRQGA